MIWKPSLHPYYEVSECGDMRVLVERYRMPVGTEITGTYDRNGYRTYRLGEPGNGGRDGKRLSYSAHRLVLFAFVGEPPSEKHECAHFDGDPANNHVSNLRWATPAENAQDKIRHGTTREGNKKFTEAQVLRMREMREQGARYIDIQGEFVISKGNLSAILNRQTWTHI